MHAAYIYGMIIYLFIPSVIIADYKLINLNCD